MQQVLFSWLVVGELRQPAEVLGAVQLTNSLPVLLLLLPAGVVADRLERRRLSVLVHAGWMLAVAGLATTVSAGRLSLPVVFVYAAAAGTLAALVIPTRDAMLSDVVKGDLMRAVTAVTVAQFGGQALGSLLAGSARFLSLGPTLYVQAALLGAAAVGYGTLPRSLGHGARHLDLREIVGGLSEVAASPTMRATLLLMSGVGLFLAGAYFVVLPVLVRDYYRGDVAQLALFMTVLQGGTVVGAAALLVSRRMPRRGPALAASLALSALPLLALGLGLSYPVALGVAFFWGLCVAAFNSLGRGLMQEAAPLEHRARVLSVYTLAVMGAGVLSAPLAGALTGALGPLGALVVGGGAMLVFVAGVSLTSGIGRVR
jgi:MFS family permease